MAEKKPKPEPTPEEAAAKAVDIAGLSEALENYDAFVNAQAATIWQYTELDEFNLNLEEQLFVRSYVIDRNPVAAMRRLGHCHDDPAKLKLRAKRYLSKAEVQGAVELLAKQMMEKLDITAEKIQRKLAAIGFFDVREVATFDKYGIQLLHSKFWSEEQAAAVQSIEMGQFGIKLKLYDRMRALELLSKQVGLQPEDMNPAEAARAGAEEVMSKLGTIIERMLPGATPRDDAFRLPAPTTESKH